MWAGAFAITWACSYLNSRNFSPIESMSPEFKSKENIIVSGGGVQVILQVAVAAARSACVLKPGPGRQGLLWLNAVLAAYLAAAPTQFTKSLSPAPAPSLLYTHLLLPLILATTHRPARRLLPCSSTPSLPACQATSWALMTSSSAAEQQHVQCVECLLLVLRPRPSASSRALPGHAFGLRRHAMWRRFSCTTADVCATVA